MKVLISGTGAAGLTAAYWLKKYGFTPTLVERAPTLPKGGYKIDVRGKALDVLRRMGLYEEVQAASTDMKSALLVDREGKVINEMGGDKFGHREGEDLEIIRGTLCQILMDKIPDMEFLFGDSIKSISQLHEAVQVEFKKNASRKFDLVIGADGLHSNVRNLVFGEESRFIHDLGLYLCVFTVPNYLNLDRVEMQYSELGRVAAIWNSKGDANLKACFAFTSKEPLDPRDTEKAKQKLSAAFSGIGWEVPKLLQLMQETPDFYFDIAAQICMENWSQDRTVLLGDAAYCASPMSGQGTSLALIGAYVLAGELATSKGAYRAAFEHFEKEMRPFVAINQSLGQKSANLMRSNEKKNFFTWLQEKLMRIAPGKLIEYYINRSTNRIQKAAKAIKLKDYT